MSSFIPHYNLWRQIIIPILRPIYIHTMLLLKKVQFQNKDSRLMQKLIILALKFQKPTLVTVPSLLFPVLSPFTPYQKTCGAFPPR